MNADRTPATDSPQASVAGRDPLADTVDVVRAHVAKNAVPVDELPGLIRSVHGAFTEIRRTGATA